MRRWLSHPRHWSITTRLTVVLLLTGLVPMGVSAVLNLRASIRQLEIREHRSLELLAMSTAARLDQLLIDHRESVVAMSLLPGVQKFLQKQDASPTELQNLKKALQSELRTFERIHANFDLVFLLNRDGVCVASTVPKMVGVDYRFRGYYRDSIQGKTAISGVIFGRVTGQPGVFVSAPVRDSQGEILGVAALKINISVIQKIVSAAQVGKQGEAFLIDSYGVIMAHTNPELVFQSLAPLPADIQEQIINTSLIPYITSIRDLDLSVLADNLIQAKAPGYIRRFQNTNGQMTTLGYAPLEVEPWVVAVAEPQAQFLSPIWQLAWQNGAQFVLVAGLLVGVVVWVVRSISGPLHLLLLTAQDLEQGIYDQMGRLDKITAQPDDVGRLARGLRKAAVQVQAREEQLKQQVTNLVITIDHQKKENHVQEITGSDYFQTLQNRAKTLRERR
ncbi:cache domain-containing protein [Gloeomargaritales cyanobacterium VI4D9]|nr:cache domain-containing protein [Gloeomargaritales cyanobacterium VI4D9]